MARRRVASDQEQTFETARQVCEPRASERGGSPSGLWAASAPSLDDEQGGPSSLLFAQSQTGLLVDTRERRRRRLASRVGVGAAVWDVSERPQAPLTAGGLRGDDELFTTHGTRRRFRSNSGVEVEVFVQQGAANADGNKCLLLHGNPGSIREWSPLMNSLGASVDFIAIDLPGFGESPLPRDGRALTLEGLADVATDVCRDIGWSSWITVGHSHGGGVAQTCAVRHPQTVRALVLLGTLGAPAHASYRLLALPGIKELMRWSGASLRSPRLASLYRLVFRRVLRDIFHPLPVTDADVEHELSFIAEHPTILEAMVAVTRDNPCLTLERNAPRIECETHFIHGAKDALVPIAHARNVHQLILDGGGASHFLSLPNAGHLLHRFEAAPIAEYLASVLARG